MPNRVAIYPGSFDPPTYGHLDLIHRAKKLFEHLIVAVAHNREKECLFSVQERVEMLSIVTKGIPNLEVTTFSGLTAEFARKHNAVALIRGLRVISDFEFELVMAITNRKISPDLDTVCLMPSEHHWLLSSRLVRDIAQHGGNVSEFVPPEIEERLLKKLGRMGA